MNLLDRLSSGSSAIDLFQSYYSNVVGGPLASLALDLLLILAIHAITLFFITILFMKVITRYNFCKTFIGGFFIYLAAILLVLQSHMVDIIFLSIVLDTLRVFIDPMDSFYYVVGLYTTVGSNYSPPPEWQGLALIIPFCGLFAFSLSGSALFTMLGYFFSNSEIKKNK